MGVGIKGTTRVYGVAGYPVSHSLSPIMQNAAFQAVGLDAVYVAFSIIPDRLEVALEGLGAAGVAGVNVTVPHKERTFAWVRRRTPEAEAAGAVNTIAWKDGETVGHNTDGIGFLRAAERLVGVLQGRRVLLLGAGGAAKGIGSALRSVGCSLIVSNRTRARAEVVARQWQGEVVAWEEQSLLAAANEAELVVNASSAGLHGKGLVPLDFARLGRQPFVIDLVYAPLETTFLSNARAAGCAVQDGLAMLAAQGELAFAFWHDREPPSGVMEAALRAHLRTLDKGASGA